MASAPPPPPSEASDGKVAGCDLCRAKKITPWYHEDEVGWIAECDVCDTRMVVWRRHGTQPPAEARAHMLARLGEVATQRLGEYRVDDNMRNIPDHFHANARPKGRFFGYDRR